MDFLFSTSDIEFKPTLSSLSLFIYLSLPDRIQYSQHNHNVNEIQFGEMITHIHSLFPNIHTEEEKKEKQQQQTHRLEFELGYFVMMRNMQQKW